MDKRSSHIQRTTQPARNRARSAKKSTRSFSSSSGGGFFSGLFMRLSHVDWGRWRIKTLGLIFALVWCSLWGRLYYIQIIKAEEYAPLAKRQHVASERITGTRGSIVDRTGLVLARSVEMQSVYADPARVEDADAAAKVLAPILGMPQNKVASLLRKKKTRFVWLSRKVDDATAAAVRAAKLQGIGMQREDGRVYPLGHTAGQLLGFVNIDGQGLEGLERTFNDVLVPKPTVMPTARAAGGRHLYLDGGTGIDTRGSDVQLTLDAQVQFFAEEALAQSVTKFEATWGGALVVEVESGDILAWAQYPFFDPNNYRQSSPHIWRNRLAADALEPGSTLKPFLVGAAMQEKIVTSDTIFYCEQGRWKTSSITIRDTHKHGWLPVDKIVRYSSNIGCAKIGLELGRERYTDYLTKLGFGDIVGLPVSESRGIMRPPKKWREADLITASFGQSIASTAVQLAEAYLTLANGGTRTPLRLVKSAPESAALLENANIRYAQEKDIFSPEVAASLMRILGEVVGEGGTGANAGIEGIKVGGKTGTAQKADGETYGKGRVASFIGFVPIEKPRYLIVVIVDEPQKSPYGSVVAAPVFKHVALQTLAYDGALPEVTSDEARAATPLTTAGSRAKTSLQIDDVQVVPNVMGMSLRKAMEIFVFKGVMPKIMGNGQFVVQQSPPAGSAWHDSSDFTFWLSE